MKIRHERIREAMIAMSGRIAGGGPSGNTLTH